MRQKLFIFLGLIALAVVLVGLNAASYVQKEKVPDDEMNPNRSTYNAGATGTRAFFDLLAETGRKPIRWQEPPSGLTATADSATRPQTFVVIGPLVRSFADDEIEQLMSWVSRGGRLVVIDREPRADLLSTTANWSIVAAPVEDFPFGVDPTNQQQMTDKAPAGKPVQPSVYTRNVNAVQPSRFASSIKLNFFDLKEKSGDFKISAPAATPRAGDVNENSGKFKVATPTPTPFLSDDDYYDDEPPPPVMKKTPNAGGQGIGTGSGTITSEPENDEVYAETEKLILSAPVVHLANPEKSLLVDFPYGAGEIVYLSDPYMTSNAGISLVDNAQMAINVVASRGGIIAFDEFHHGYGNGENRLLAYFAGTPLVAILLQIVLLIGVMLYTQSRRFARPLPVFEPNRLSKLEYVAAMAELQQRTRAYDLAMENIYSEFRRTMARFAGVDNFQTSRRDLAQLVAELGGFNANELEELMFKCEDIIHGEPTSRKEVLDLTSRLRAIEEKLGLKRQRKTRR